MRHEDSCCMIFLFIFRVYIALQITKYINEDKRTKENKERAEELQRLIHGPNAPPLSDRIFVRAFYSRVSIALTAHYCHDYKIKE